MLQLRTLLVPVDFSACGDAASAWAAALAARFGAELVLLHAIELPRGIDRSALVDSSPSGTGVPIPLTEWAAEAGRSAAHRLARSLRARGLHVRVEVVEGPPVASILEAADRLRPDAIVLGTHGRRGLAHAFMGSVAERVVRASPCPVITIKAPANARASEAHELPAAADRLGLRGPQEAP